MSAAQSTAWPSRLDGRGNYLTRLRPEDVERVWHQLEDPQNARLYERVYGQSCLAPDDFRTIVNEEAEGRTRTASYKVHDAHMSASWIVMHDVDTAAGVLSAAMFLSREARMAMGGRAFFPIVLRAFDVLGYKRIEWCWGSLSRGDDQPHPYQMLGTSLIAVMSRQLLVAEEEDGDRFEVTAEQHQLIKRTLAAWDASFVQRSRVAAKSEPSR